MDNINLVDYVAQEFKAAELVLIAEKVGLAPTSNWGNRRLVETIQQVIKKSGVPKADLNSKDRATSLLADFLYVAGYTDEQGAVIEAQRKPVPLPSSAEWEEGLKQYLSSKSLAKPPDCFGFADDEDPECRRCGVQSYCYARRVANLPPCFGIHYLSHAPECGVCMEAPFCRQGTVLADQGKSKPIMFEEETDDGEE